MLQEVSIPAKFDILVVAGYHWFMMNGEKAYRVASGITSSQRIKLVETISTDCVVAAVLNFGERKVCCASVYIPHATSRAGHDLALEEIRRLRARFPDQICGGDYNWQGTSEMQHNINKHHGDTGLRLKETATARGDHDYGARRDWRSGGWRRLDYLVAYSEVQMGGYDKGHSGGPHRPLPHHEEMHAARRPDTGHPRPEEHRRLEQGRVPEGGREGVGEERRLRGR